MPTLSTMQSTLNFIFSPLNIMYYLEIHHISKWNEVVNAISCIKCTFETCSSKRLLPYISSRSVVAFQISFIFKSNSALEHMPDNPDLSRHKHNRLCAWTVMNYMFDVRNHNQPSVDNIWLSMQASDITGLLMPIHTKNDNFKNNYSVHTSWRYISVYHKHLLQFCHLLL